jgi:hypothetical protein
VDYGDAEELMSIKGRSFIVLGGIKSWREKIRVVNAKATSLRAGYAKGNAGEDERKRV